MNLDEAIRKTRKAALLLGPQIDQEIKRVHQDIRLKIARGELPPETGVILDKSFGTDRAE